MATARDIITRALRKLKVLASGESPTSEEANDSLDVLNQMLAEWRIDGIDLAQIELTLDDEPDVPASHINAITTNLALRIADDFGATITPTIALEASGGLAALTAYHFTMRDLSDENPLSRCNLPNSD